MPSLLERWRRVPTAWKYFDRPRTEPISTAGDIPSLPRRYPRHQFESGVIRFADTVPVTLPNTVVPFGANWVIETLPA